MMYMNMYIIVFMFTFEYVYYVAAKMKVTKDVPSTAVKEARCVMLLVSCSCNRSGKGAKVLE